MRLYGSVIFLLALFTSCQWRERVSIDERELLEQELDKIDWDHVDAYPTLEACDSLIEADERRNCFFEYISMYIQEELEQDTLVSVFPTVDTLEVIVTVYPDAKVSIEPLQASTHTSFNTEELDSILKLRFRDLPPIQPALKRGIPVKTQFVLPVILKRE